MAFTPFNSIAQMLTHVNEARALNIKHPAQKNADLNGFKYKQYVGPEDQTIIIKEFNSSSYNGPTTNDFVERLNIIFEAAKTTLKPEQLTTLKKAHNSTLKEIMSECKIEPVQNTDELLSNEKDLIKTINKAKHLLQEFVFKSILIIDADAFKNKNRATEILAEMLKKESEIIATTGRPNFINYYPVTHNNGITNRVSINRVVGHAIPSTERSRSKLPNFVECGVGYMDGGQYVSQFNGYRHSSYTPINMIDKKYGDSNYELFFGHRKKLLSTVNQIKFTRRQAAALCAKEMFAELARQHIAKGANPDQPIQITLSSLALLSPIRGDKMFMRRGESEHRQLKESYNALMMYNGRSVAMNVDGKKITVMPSINIMNAASNWHGIKVSKYLPSTLEKNINAEGLNKYITEATKHLHSQYIIDDKTINLLHMKQERVKQNLFKLYTSLDNYLNQSVNPSSNVEYIDLLQSIEKSRHENYILEHQILNQRMKLLQEKRSDIQTYLRDTLPAMTKKPDIDELFYQSLFMYIDKQVEPAQFGARYLLVNEKIGNNVDFYCKSGEDRTGRMQNLIEELCEFSKEKNHFPRYDLDKRCINKDDETRQRIIAKTVSERTVSRDNCDANARGARGLQITSALELNTGLPNLSGSKMGALAKGVYDVAAIKKLWHSLNYLYANMAKVVKSNMTFFKKQINPINNTDKVENSRIWTKPHTKTRM